MSVASTLYGYHVQYLYTLYRMLESADSKEVFVPEGREDLKFRLWRLGMVMTKELFLIN